MANWTLIPYTADRTIELHSRKITLVPQSNVKHNRLTDLARIEPLDSSKSGFSFDLDIKDIEQIPLLYGKYQVAGYESQIVGEGERKKYAEEFEVSNSSSEFVHYEVTIPQSNGHQKAIEAKLERYRHMPEKLPYAVGHSSPTQIIPIRLW